MRKHRKAARITQSELGALVRLSRSGISNIELGNYNPNLDDLAEIAYELRIPLSYLFEGAQHEDRDTLYSKLKQEYMYLQKKHETLIKEMTEVLKRNY
jgi:transcriptional regulator with XRE-family HTH domain